MAYTPELSMRSSCTLRRISWALSVPMTQGIEFLFEHLPQILDREKVCRDAGTGRNARSALSTRNPILLS